MGRNQSWSLVPKPKRIPVGGLKPIPTKVMIILTGVVLHLNLGISSFDLVITKPKSIKVYEEERKKTSAPSLIFTISIDYQKDEMTQLLIIPSHLYPPGTASNFFNHHLISRNSRHKAHLFYVPNLHLP